MSLSPYPKPIKPKGAKDWWHLDNSALSPEQIAIKESYYKRTIEWNKTHVIFLCKLIKNSIFPFECVNAYTFGILKKYTSCIDECDNIHTATYDSFF